VLNRIVLLSLGYALLNTAFAATDGIRLSNNQISLHSISTNVDYTETNNTGVLDTEDGRVSGLAVSLSSMKNGWVKSEYWYADYDYSKGRTRYVGAYISGGGGYGSVVSTSGAVLSNYSFRYGKGFTLNNSTMLTPYAELGHHFWDRGVNYGEVYTHYYTGLGGLFQYSPNQSVVLSLNGLYGNTKNSHIKVVGGGGGDYGFAGPLGNSPLTRIGLAVDFRVDDNIYAKLSAERTRFIYGKSAVYYTGTGYFLEPDSSTSYTIVKLGLGHTF